MSMLPDLKVRQGETLSLVWEDESPTAETATIIVKSSLEAATASITRTASLVDGAADLTLNAGLINRSEGEYIYQVTVHHTDGVVEKYPEPDNCEDDEECRFPLLTICSALDQGVS